MEQGQMNALMWLQAPLKPLPLTCPILGLGRSLFSFNNILPASLPWHRYTCSSHVDFVHGVSWHHSDPLLITCAWDGRVLQHSIDTSKKEGWLITMIIGHILVVKNAKECDCGMHSIRNGYHKLQKIRCCWGWTGAEHTRVECAPGCQFHPSKV